MKDDEIPKPHAIMNVNFVTLVPAFLIKKLLKSTSGFEWFRLSAWIMREATFADVWQFLTPEEVRDSFSQIKPFLGRKKSFWNYILSAWHGLGKI